MARVSRPLVRAPVELAPEPVHAERTWVSAYEVDPFEVPEARAGRPAGRAVRAAARLRRGRTTSTPSCWRAGEHVLRRTGRHLDDPAAGADRPRLRGGARRRRWLPHHEHGRAARPAAAGSTSPAPGGTSTPRSPSCRSGWPSTPRRRRSRPGRYDLVIEPTNLWLTIHESVAHATELDRALGYEAAYAGTSFATFDQLGTLQYGSRAHERHRRPGHRARAVDRRLRRRGGGGADLRHHLRRGPGGLPAQPADGPGEGPGPLQRLCLRRLGRAHPAAAHAQRVAGRRPAGPRRGRARSPGWTGASTSSATSRGRSTCSATTSSSPGSGSTPSRTAGSPARSATWPTRRPPPTSGVDGRRRRALDLPAGGVVQLRQGPAGAEALRSATAARPRCSGTSTCSTPASREAD